MNSYIIAIKLDKCNIHIHSLWQHVIDKICQFNTLCASFCCICATEASCLWGSEKEKTLPNSILFRIYIKRFQTRIHVLHTRHQKCIWPPLCWFMVDSVKWKLFLFFPPQISFCIKKGRRPLHHPLRSTSASVRTGQIESPRRKSLSLSRYEDEIHDASFIYAGRCTRPCYIAKVSC